MKAPILYNYHPETKEFTGATYAKKSPLEEGVFLHPANTTETEPLEVGEGEVAVFENDGWVKKDDLRGSDFYNISGERFTMEDLGILPDWALTEYPEVTEETYNSIILYDPKEKKEIRTHFQPPVYWQKANDLHFVEQAEIEPPEGKKYKSTKIEKVDANYYQLHSYVNKTKADLTAEWENEMAMSDSSLPRALEDIIDVLPDELKQNISPETLEKYQSKKEKRAEKP